jgi:hypothetical protein
MQVTDEIYKNVYRHQTFGLLSRYVRPIEALIWPNVEAINRSLEGEKPSFMRSLTAFYRVKSSLLGLNP